MFHITKLFITWNCSFTYSKARSQCSTCHEGIEIPYVSTVLNDSLLLLKEENSVNRWENGLFSFLLLSQSWPCTIMLLVSLLCVLDSCLRLCALLGSILSDGVVAPSHRKPSVKMRAACRQTQSTLYKHMYCMHIISTANEYFLWHFTFAGWPSLK